MSKEKVLHNPIAYEARKADIEFAAPRKERATTGRFMPPGDDYGIGFRQPVGTPGNPKSMQSGPIPQEASCFLSDEAIRR
jgi:hypothetical protein